MGHALEQLEKYRLPHGQAVAVGLLVECYISYLHGYLPFEEWERILDAARKSDLRIALPRSFSFGEMMQAMSGDKKSIQKTPRFVQIRRIGTPETFSGKYCAPATTSVLEEAIEWMNSQLVKETLNNSC